MKCKVAVILSLEISGKFTQGWADFELKGGKLMRSMGIGVKPPLHPAPQLVSFHTDVYIRLRMSKDLIIVRERLPASTRRATDEATMCKASICSKLPATVAFSATSVHRHFSRAAAIVGRTARGGRLLRQEGIRHRIFQVERRLWREDGVKCDNA